MPLFVGVAVATLARTPVGATGFVPTANPARAGGGNREILIP
jgi:hypothetical protein